MQKNIVSLLVYLESQFVLKDGLINEGELSQVDRITIEHWQDEGMLAIEKLPKPDRSPNTDFTHKVRMTKGLFDLAHTARQKYAERHKPLLDSKADRKSALKLVQNGKVKDAPPRQKKSTGQPAPDKTIDYEHFQSWLEDKAVNLTPPQQQMARLMFAVFNDPALRLMVNNRGAGQSFLFKTIDQYLTLIKNNAFKNSPSKKEEE